MSFYPQHAQIPDELRTKVFLLRPLRTTDVELDYAALMVSKEMLRRWSQSDWPTDDFTLEDNLKDLKRHEEEHLERKAFTFTVLDSTGSECLGCVYINPLARLLEYTKASEDDLAVVNDHESVVAFWVRQPRLSDDLDKRLLKALIDWFKRKWAFSGVAFSTNDQDTRQMCLFDESGLGQRYVLNMPGEAAKFLVYD